MVYGNLSSAPNFNIVLFFSDQCVFHILGIAKTQNTYIGRSENPKNVKEHDADSVIITFYYAIQANEVLDIF